MTRDQLEALRRVVERLRRAASMTGDPDHASFDPDLAALFNADVALLAPLLDAPAAERDNSPGLARQEEAHARSCFEFTC